MKFEELSKILEFNQEYENDVFIPNEIFSDLKKYIKKSPHIPFAYAYYYLTNWLYRFTKYTQTATIIDVKFIKKVLGYSPTYPEVNYLIKNKGLLQEMGYIYSSNDIPLVWTFDGDELNFDCISDLDDTDKNLSKMHFEKYGKNYKIKVPVKGLWRTEESTDIDVLDGTFFDVRNTHMIPFEVFVYCMTNKNIGVSGFYIYSYLKQKNDMFNGYDVSVEGLSQESGIPVRTINRILDNLKKYKLISFHINQEFVIGLKREERLANTYYTNDFIQFSDTPVDYITRRVISEITYFKRKKEEEKLKEMVEEGMDLLPSKAQA
ncbi:hypothetical protein [Bacillus marinisedimentorum]|uniref:hypothetical protein n=1 Tax=Bacillus marinisedimentorum TaxID=1821260 RepID=UPI0007DFB850|nr:hypothetical protein [Bacillus marinisedimentorum]